MARKRKGLPFVLQPRLKPILEDIGNEDVGVFQIERRGYLSVAEKAIAQGGMQGDTTIRRMYSLAGKIARETGKQQGEVAQDLVQPDRAEYLQPWDDEISDCVMDMLAFQERMAIVQATALLISRINTEWTVEETMELDPEILAQLALLYHDEEARTIEALEAAAEEAKGPVEGKS